MQTDEMQSIMNRIKTRREELGMTYQVLSEKTGISKSSLQRYETGAIKNMPLDKIEVISKALETTPDYLMGWNKKESSNNYQLNNKDIKEIDRYMEKVAEDLSSNSIQFDGEPLDEESLQLVLSSMRVGIELAKKKNKEKYTPNKYRDNN